MPPRINGNNNSNLFYPHAVDYVKQIDDTVQAARSVGLTSNDEFLDSVKQDALNSKFAGIQHASFGRFMGAALKHWESSILQSQWADLSRMG